MLPRLTRRFVPLVLCALIGAGGAVVAPAGAANTSVNIDQCANENATATVPCDWQNGNLNGNNSNYSEGDVVPFRLAIENVDAGAHTIHINYDFTAGGHKAYDFLAAYESTENVNLCANGGGGTSSLCGNPRNESNLPAPLTVSIPSDGTLVDGLPVSGAEAASGLTRALTVFGATSASATAPVHSGDPAANSSADITVSFTTTGNNADVLIAWGGHLARSAYWTVNDGAGNVSGAPWHMSTLNLDSGGSARQDRSIQSSAIAPRGSITVVKQTNPDGSTQSFSFDPSWSDTNFSLADGQEASSGELAPGTYSVAEVSTLGWTQTSAVCSDGSQASAISLAADETVTCTFTNTLNPVPPAPAQLTVIKHVVNDNGGTATASDFTISVTGSSPTPASFPGAESPGTSVILNAGSYSVSESEAGPAGYAMSLSADCSGLITAGQTKTCTVTNDDIAPRLTVIKHVVTDNGGNADADDFTMRVTGTDVSPAEFPGDEAGTTVTLDAGSYSVSEDVHNGYASVDPDTGCSGTLALDQDVTCTITNDDVPDNRGHIVVQKVTLPTASTQAFAFTADYDEDGFSLANGQSNDSGLLVPGTYSVAETATAGWNLTGVDCSDGSDPDSIDLDAGETVTCVFTNTQTIVVVDDDVTPADGGNPGTTNPGTTNPGTTNTEVDSVSETAGSDPTPPLQTVPVQVPALPATIPATASDPALSPATELPRTGAGLREETLLALVLMLAGLSARALGRRRNGPAGA